MDGRGPAVHASMHSAREEKSQVREVRLRETQYISGELQANADTNTKNSLLLNKKASDEEGAPPVEVA